MPEWNFTCGDTVFQCYDYSGYGASTGKFLLWISLFKHGDCAILPSSVGAVYSSPPWSAVVFMVDKLKPINSGNLFPANI
ncbi:hypothetical protein U1Q18_007484 [Sarracenia purpurea var. burkii]